MSATEKVTRRKVLGGVAGGAALVAAAPLINTIFPFWKVRRTPDGLFDIEEFAERFFDHPASDASVAYAANPGLLLRLLSGTAAVATILDWLNIRPNFGQSVDFSRTGRCEGNFQQVTSEQRRNGITEFSGVHHSSSDGQAAILAARDPYNQRAMLATQYGPVHPSVALTGDKPAWLQAGIEALRQDEIARGGNLQGAPLARTASIIKSVETSANGVAYHGLANANNGGFLYDGRRRSEYPLGRLVAAAPNRQPVVVTFMPEGYES